MEVLDLGVALYEDVLEEQKGLLRNRIEGGIPDTLILVEHFPVVTLGRLAKESSIIDRDYFMENKIPVVKTARGGKVTYHAPGQLVLYPVMDLIGKRRDVGSYIDFLEKTVSNALNLLAVPAARKGKRRGVWVRDEKIAFIGIAVKRWVTFHGVAVNINNDIGPFSRMHPCGETDIRVTSAKECLGREIDMAEAKKIFAEQFIRDLEAEYGNKYEHWNYSGSEIAGTF
ncbi:MAG: lipoyl(octanoyl) transferase LipB [Candidatus Omnitrophota bacterium]|nr:lipoyl(octanoyl) transferase LipB [Candidatus Omnitrophota bacterium]